MRRAERAVALAVFAAAWITAAVALWPSRVPDDLRLPAVDERELFSAGQLSEAQRYDTFLRWDYVLSQLVVLVVLGLYAWRGHRLARESAAGRIGTGMLLGMLGLGILWFTQIPFQLAAIWWQRRYGVEDIGYVDWFFGYWFGLAGEFAFICLALLIVMGFAQTLRSRWWVAGAPTFVALYVLFAYTMPFLIPDTHPFEANPGLAEAARTYARAQGTDPIPVRVEDVSMYTDDPNAFAAGMERTRKIFIWDTLLDGRFTNDEVEMVLAHEIAHHSRDHIWKGIAWYALFAVPGTYLIALATRRRGSLREAHAVPVALFAFVALSLAAQPIFGVITRRMEAEADWVALETTKNPQAARALFRHFTTITLTDPSPPTWAKLLVDTHPTNLERIRMAEAWRARASGGSSHP